MPQLETKSNTLMTAAPDVNLLVPILISILFLLRLDNLLQTHNQPFLLLYDVEIAEAMVTSELNVLLQLADTVIQSLLTLLKTEIPKHSEVPDMIAKAPKECQIAILGLILQLNLRMILKMPQII